MRVTSDDLRGVRSGNLTLLLEAWRFPSYFTSSVMESVMESTQGRQSTAESMPDLGLSCDPDAAQMPNVAQPPASSALHARAHVPTKIALLRFNPVSRARACCCFTR